MFQGWNRLSEELSPEDEGNKCRICYGVCASPDDPLLSPCLCVGSLQFVHSSCLKTWIQMKIKSGQSRTVTKICELCKGELNVDLMMFRQKANSPAQLQDKAETHERQQRRAKILRCLKTACKIIILLSLVLVMVL